MALRLLKGEITKEGKIMIIFSGGGKQVWYPSGEEITKIYNCIIHLERLKEKISDLEEAELNQEV